MGGAGSVCAFCARVHPKNRAHRIPGLSRGLQWWAEMAKPSRAVRLPRPAFGTREEGLLGGGEAVEGFEEESGAES